MHTLAERFADYAAALRYEQLPAGVVNEVKRRVPRLPRLRLRCLAFRARHPCPAGSLRLLGRPRRDPLGTNHRAPPDWAAFANGCLVRYLDYNDTYLSKEPAHPSDNIPALAAVAEAEGRAAAISSPPS